VVAIIAGVTVLRDEAPGAAMAGAHGQPAARDEAEPATGPAFDTAA
jgi:hypothetical protein